MWMTSCTGSARGGFWGFWKKLVESCSPKRKGDSLAFSGLVAGATRVERVGGRWKSQHRKIVPLSPYVEKPLNSKVIKSFVPEQRNRKCFSCFGILMFNVYMLWTFYVRFTYPYQDMVQGNSSEVYPFDEIPIAELGFEFSQIFLIFFPFISVCLWVYASIISKTESFSHQR